MGGFEGDRWKVAWRPTGAAKKGDRWRLGVAERARPGGQEFLLSVI